MSNELSVAAVILAGGEGRRMDGEDKGLVHFQQRPMISWTLDKISPLVNEVLISCNRNYDQYESFGVGVVSDKESGFLGPLAGVQAALNELSARHSHLLILPCDTPLVSDCLLQRLIQQSIESPQDIIYLNESGRAHFLHAIIPTQYADNLNTSLEEGVRAVYRWYKQYPITEIDTSPYAHTLININQLSQLQGTA
jgi:molybdopterin-guanine dinucleotide biosynthesis protein A